MDWNVLGNIGSIFSNLLNFGTQAENLKYQKDLQQQIFEREDNAVQRRAADLQAAGLNPVLAAGGAASAGSVVATSAPQINNNWQQLAQNSLRMKKDFAQQDAQIAALQQSAAKTKEEAIQAKRYNDWYGPDWYNNKFLHDVTLINNEIEQSNFARDQAKTELAKSNLSYNNLMKGTQMRLDAGMFPDVQGGSAIDDYNRAGIYNKLLESLTKDGKVDSQAAIQLLSQLLGAAPGAARSLAPYLIP